MTVDRVVSVHDGFIKVACSTRACRQTVRDLGGRRVWLGHHWKIPFKPNDGDIAKIFDILRKKGFAFAGASSGWPPAEVFRKLREEGLLEGSFFEVTWDGPGESNAHVREV